MNPTAPLSLTDRFVLPLQGLYAAVAARFQSAGWTIPLIWAVCNRIQRAERRVAKLLALFLAGALPPETAAVPRRRKTEVREAQERVPANPGVGVKIPRGYGWLIRMVPYVAAGYAGQLRLALADPEMMALLAASPKARRALAPVCRMLMIEPEVLAPNMAVEPAPEGAVQDDMTDAGRSVAEAAGMAPAGVGCQSGSPPARDGLQGQGPPLIDTG